MYVSGEFGRQWLGTSTLLRNQISAFPFGIPEPSYNTWNIGVGFTYKVFTLDFRYSDTNLSKGLQRLHQRLHRTSQARPTFRDQPGGFGSNWCGATGIAKLSVDLTAATNLK